MDNPYTPPKSDSTAIQKLGKEVPIDILASRWKRLLAVILDGIACGVIQVPIQLFLGTASFQDPKVAAVPINMITNLAIGFGVFALIQSYFIIKNGQTIGKKVLSIKVVKTDGSPISLEGYLFLRLLPFWLLSSIPVVGVYLSFIGIIPIFFKKRRCLHDFIAGTEVRKCA